MAAAAVDLAKEVAALRAAVDALTGRLDVIDARTAERIAEVARQTTALEASVERAEQRRRWDARQGRR